MLLIQLRRIECSTCAAKETNGVKVMSELREQESHEGDGKGPWEVLEFTGGLREYVTWINRDKEAMHEPLYARTTIDNVVVEMALQW